MDNPTSDVEVTKAPTRGHRRPSGYLAMGVWRQTPAPRWRFIVLVAFLGGLTLPFLDWLRVDLLAVEILAIMFIAAVALGIFTRAKLAENIEDEFSSGPVPLRRRFNLFWYEVSLLVSIVICLSGAAAAVMYLTTTKTGFNPFDRSVGPGRMFYFFFDQAVKGAFVDILKVYEINLPGVLSIDPRKYPFFVALVVFFRWLSSFVLIAGIGLLFYRLFLKRRAFRAKQQLGGNFQS